MIGKDIWKLFRPRTPAAKEALDRFSTNYQRLLDINNSIALSILVWGPSLKSNNRIANKRRDIHSALLERGHNAMFSEELGFQDGKEQREVLSLKTLEYAQAMAADLVIILLGKVGEDATGALAEAQDFANHPDLASKLYVLAPKSYKGGYVGRSALLLLEKGYGGVYWYDDPEIESCNVRSEALIRAQARREISANFAYARGGERS